MFFHTALHTPLGLPYLLDDWVGASLHHHVSIQIQLLSGNIILVMDDEKDIKCRVATDHKDFVVTVPLKTLRPQKPHSIHMY